MKTRCVYGHQMREKLEEKKETKVRKRSTKKKKKQKKIRCLGLMESREVQSRNA